MKISYGITVHNESDELNKLLEILLPHIDKEDEIVICVDGDDTGIQLIIEKHKQHKQIISYKRKLEKDFAAHKNSVIEKSSGDYIFHIDADEYPHETLLEQLKTVEGFTDADVKRWGWRITEKGWVNYPDYQARVFRNTEDIMWVRPLHEYIIGCKTYAHLPPHEELSLYHPKTKEKQEEQNLYYNTNFSKQLNVRKV